ncbi:acetyl-CoA carboxylase biotin carboxyl carrier protein subunit [Zunongwangia sp. H14]|uniref:acetyl-CoA carboxylase biotin carboxyl carrier protein subunit n=1 Tax=Zunongwangia sp. H14 TaxID=3240792 RepID=UPI00356876A7
MEKKYKIKVNNSYEYEFTKDEIDALDQQQISASKFHVLKDNHSFKAEILDSNFNNKKYSVKINSNSYEVDISNELDLLIEAMGLSLGSAQLLNDIKAPMPGLILDVNVKEGDEVKEGDYLLVLEAMKMENTLSAPGDGIIKSIHVEKGQTVEKNQLLIELE